MRYCSRLILCTFVAIFTLAPQYTLAQTNAELQAQAAALLQKVEELQRQLGLSTASAPSTSASAVVGCLSTSRILKPGMEGADVVALQKFLAKDASIYPEGLVTGYYGALTTAAVQRWQAKNNIVSSGTPESTGYGQVGPRTAATMNASCGAASPLAGGYIEVTPVSGPPPLTVSVRATVNTVRSCDAATYTLDWGDGVTPQQIPVPAGNCGQLQQTYTHLYQYDGTYSIRLISGAHQSSATVVVGSGAAGTTASGQRFDASLRSGTAPLTVRFSGVLTTDNLVWNANSASYNTLDFGDGTSAQIQLPTQKGTAQAFTVDHTYVTAGSYAAVLYQGTKASARGTVGTAIPITVQGGQGGLPAQVFQGSPQSGTAPLKVTFTGTLNSQNLAWCATGCTNTLDFGDNTSVQIPLPKTAGTAQSFTAEHTYVSGGTFTARLHQGAIGASLVGSPISITVAGGSSLPAQSLSATPLSGDAPLTVTFSGTLTGENKGWCAQGCTSTLDFGDGTSVEIALPTSQTGANTFTVQHTYVTPGAHLSVLHQGAKNSGNTPVGVATISVGGTAPSAYQYKAVVPSVTGERTVSLQFDIPTACTGFDISWGDSSALVGQSHTTGCGGSATSRTYSHQFSTGGSYTITLRRGADLSRIDTVQVNISN